MLVRIVIIAVFNQKGGVGRTTTALNLLAAIGRAGQRPWGIDLDPQAHLSRAFGAIARRPEDSVYAFFAHGTPLADVAQITRSGVVLCPAHLELAKADAVLGKGMASLTRLRQALQRETNAPGHVVIDCSPLLNVLTLNAVFACDLVVVPISSDFLALRAATDVERALDALEPVVKHRLPRKYVLTRFRPDEPMSLEIAERMTSLLRPDEICVARIRENRAIAESLSLGLDVFRHAPDSEGAQDYAALYEELAAVPKRS